MLHIAVCDDIEKEREELCRVIRDVFAGYDLDVKMMAFQSGEALLAAWEEYRDVIRLVFLDIYMAGIDGVETARRLRAAGYGETIVFLTMTPDFAIEGYEVKASGYLLKPLDREKLGELIKRLFESGSPAMLVLRQGKRVYTIAPSDIVYIESNRNRLAIHTVNDTYSYYGRLDEVAGRLPGKSFLRCHQSYLVNMDRIFAAGDDFRMDTGDVVPIRVRERRIMRDTYFRYITGRDL